MGSKDRQDRAMQGFHQMQSQRYFFPITELPPQTGVAPTKIKRRPRLLSGNGSAFMSHELAKYLAKYQLKQLCGAPYYPQTQRMIARCHCSMKSIVKLKLLLPLASGTHHYQFRGLLHPAPLPRIAGQHHSD